MSSSTASTCTYCDKPNATYRCAQCKQVNYCSRECQKSGWKAHKKACRAWGELSSHVQTLPLEEAHRRFQQAQDTIQKLEKMVEDGATEKLATGGQKKESSRSNESPKSVRESEAATPTAKSATKKSLPKREMLPQKTASKKPPVLDPVTIHPDWNCTMEELVHLDSYQITLQPAANISLPEPLPEVHLQAHTNATRITIGDLVSWKLPAVVSDYRVAQLPNDCLSIRFQCTPDAFVVPYYTSATTTNRIEQLACKSCDSQLLSADAASIDRVVPLPSGYWDEIADYIQCYPGEAVVEFGTTVVPPSCAWEDAHVFVLNSENVKDVAITTLPSVDPYGTSTGPTTELLSWQPEGRQVETLCCSYCCAALGVVTNQGYHLYKHRLLLSQEQDTVATAAAPVPIFIANELKRYAESQAIFTFVVVAASSSSQHSKDKISCLLLHVLSWDSTMLAVRGGREEASPTANTSSHPKKKRVVKIIYEESSQLPAFHREENATDDITSWSWGGLDLCCDPGDASSNTTTKAKSVVLTLEDDEFTELADSIRSSPYYFPQQVVDATIMVKLGIKEARSKATVGMTALDLI